MKNQPISHSRQAYDKAKPPYNKPELAVLPTTLWEYPSQHYGRGVQGDPRYRGATPSWVIWQLLMRYTRQRDLIIDPMAGSGTTLDVARELGRRALAYDLAPSRDDIFRADARKLPLEDAKADFVFIDPPYSTHIDYGGDDRCIGKLDAGAPPQEPPQANHNQAAGAIGSAAHPNAYYQAMEQVIAETHRILRQRRYMALYVSDSYKKGKAFMPIGFELFAILRRQFLPVDIICVKRQNAKLKRGNWRSAAVKENFFLRGFNYCFIMKKV